MVCDGPVAGSVHPGLPAALPLPQAEHHRALAAPRQGAAAGTHSPRQRLPDASSSPCNPNCLRLTGRK